MNILRAHYYELLASIYYFFNKEKTLEYLEEAYSLYPENADNTDTLKFLTVLTCHLGKYDKTIFYGEKLLSTKFKLFNLFNYKYVIYKKNVSQEVFATYFIAMAKGFLGKYEEAISLIESCKKECNENLFHRATGLFKTYLGQYKEALEDLDKVVDIHCDFYYKQAKIICFFELGRNEEALSLISELQKDYPSFDYPYSAKIVCLANLNKEEECKQEIDKVLKKFSDNVTLIATIGYSLVKLCKYNEALPFLEKSVELDSNNDIYLLNLSNCLLNLNKNEDAIKAINKAIELNPNDYKKYYNKGLAQFKQALYKEAIIEFDKALSLKEDINVYYDKSCCYDKLGDYTNAIQTYKKAIDLTDNEQILSNIYATLSAYFCRANKFQEAILNANKSLEYNQKNQYALNNKAYALHKSSQKLNEALTLSNEAIEIEPIINFYYTRAYIKFALQDFEGAIQDYKKLLYKEDSSFNFEYESFEDVFSTYLDAKLKLNKKDEAKNILNEVIKHKPDYAKYNEKLK